MIEDTDNKAVGQKNNNDDSSKQTLVTYEDVPTGNHNMGPPINTWKIEVKIINESITAVVGTLSSDSIQFYIREETGIDTRNAEQLVDKGE